MTTIGNLELLPTSIRTVVRDYAACLAEALGTRLKSLAVYGSATGPDYISGRSNVNIAAVLDRLDAPVLDAVLGVVSAGMKKRIVPPLLVTPEYVRSAVDVFPIEFLEIKDTQVVLLGEDYFSDLRISEDRLRLECESQLRASVLRTRQAYLEIGLAKRGAERVLHASVTALVPVFKAILRLRKAPVPRGKIEVVRALGEVEGLGVDVFAAVLRDRSGDEKIRGRDARRVLADYMDAVEALTRNLESVL
jgi:hypothetical protein